MRWETSAASELSPPFAAMLAIAEPGKLPRPSTRSVNADPLNRRKFLRDRGYPGLLHLAQEDKRHMHVLRGHQSCSRKNAPSHIMQ